MLFRLRDGELTPRQVDDFRDFLEAVDRDLLRHRVILHNEYTHWFQAGTATDEELAELLTRLRAALTALAPLFPGALQPVRK